MTVFSFWKDEDWDRLRNESRGDEPVKTHHGRAYDNVHYVLVQAA
jgi:hypothetical protein